MTRRASFSQAELSRVAKVAQRLGGLKVVIEAGVISLLPISTDGELPSDDLTDSDWAERLAQWRHSA